MIGILTAIEMEAASISAQLERAEAGCCGPLRCRHGYLGGQEVVLALCGIGKVNAALHTQMLIDQYGVDRLLHTGVAGAVAPAVKPMDLVIGRTLCYHDVPAELQKLMTPSQLFYESALLWWRRRMRRRVPATSAPSPPEISLSPMRRPSRRSICAPARSASTWRAPPWPRQPGSPRCPLWCCAVSQISQMPKPMRTSSSRAPRLQSGRPR